MNSRLDPSRRAAICEGALEALFELPERIGRYEIHGELGRGGMGVIYDAFDPNLSRRVAIKVIAEQHLEAAGFGEREIHQRFEREMRATSQLFHPNLVTILDAGIGSIGGSAQAYYLMERIEGESLELRLRRAGPMTREEGLRVAAAIARGLAVVHQEGLVHRDLKPSNILLPKRGEAKLTDFGLSHWRLDPLDDYAEKGILGSAHYLSPEQVTQAKVDSRTDLFSLGAILVHILTGAPPFGAPSLSAHLGRIMSDAPDGLASLDRDVRSLVSQLLAKDPSDRPESTSSVAGKLESLAGALDSASYWRRGGRRVAVALSIVGAASASIGLWAHQDLARLEAERHRSRNQLEAQFERSRALIPAFALRPDSGVDGAFAERMAIRDEATGTLNRIAVERRRHEEAEARLSARLNALPWSLFSGFLPDRPGELGGLDPFDADRKLSDPEGRLSAQQSEEVEEQLRLLMRELKVDARVLFVRPPAGESFEDFGARAFESLDATGSGPGERGMLLLVDVEGGRARIEMGYAIEPHLFDSMAGALAREHLIPVEMDRLGLDLRLILRVVRLRLRGALLAGTFPVSLEEELTGRHGAGGAGASAFVGAPLTTLPVPLEASDRMAFAAGSSVRETYRRYLEWMQHGGFDASVGIFTDESRTLLSLWRATPVYLDLALRSHSEGPVAIIESERVAMLYAMGDPLAPPHFFQRAGEHWQIDLAARERHVLPIAGGRFTWTLRRIEEHPLGAFRAELQVVDSLIRIRAGDNRPLPNETGPRVARARF